MPSTPASRLLALFSIGTLAVFSPCPHLLAQAVGGSGGNRPPLGEPGIRSNRPGQGGTTAKRENAVSITTEGGYRIIKSNGWPDHVPGAFPRRGNPNTISPQDYTFRIPLKPSAASEPQQRGGWFFGVALNGVPFEAGTAETWNNDRTSGWRYEAHTGFLDLGLDEHNAHVQPTGAYHYHAMPTGLVQKLGGDEGKMLLIAWAADGFPTFAANCHGDPKDAKSAIRQMKSSYRLKPGARPVEANGPGGNYDGRFTQDWEFLKDSGDLDECNGHTAATAEHPEGIYHYHITTTFPFLPRAWHGTPDDSFGKGGPGPGGPRGPGGAGMMPGGFPLPLVIRALDANGDGIIDSEEIANTPAALRTLDRNGDGRLTPDEFRGGDLPPGGPPPPR